MSRQSGLHVDGSAGAIAGLRPGALQQPLAKESIDFFIRGGGMIAAEILAHQVQPRLEQVEGGPERVSQR